MVEYRLGQLTDEKEDACLTASVKCSQEIKVEVIVLLPSDNKKKVDSDNKVHDDDFVDEEIILEPDNDFNSAFRPQDQAHASFSYRAAIDSVVDFMIGSFKCVQIVQDLPVDNLVVLHPSKQRPRPQISPDFNQILKTLNSQGDNQSIENFGNNSDTINVAVNATFSRYAKFVTLILIINILLMLKIVVWDSFFFLP